MPASACLRIVLDVSDETYAKLDALGPLVAKVTSAFLESRWSWPKRHALLTPFSFILTDPKATELDVARLESLAEELQLKLFGTSTFGGEVSLVLHDGDEADTALFLQMDHASLRSATREPLQPTPFGGRILKISATPGAPPGLYWRTLERAPLAQATVLPKGAKGGALHVSFRGIYCPPRQAFVGNAITVGSSAAEFPYSVVDGTDQMPHDHAEEYDLACLDAGARLLESRVPGLMYLPICFTSLMRRSTRAIYEQQIGALPVAHRHQLVAAIYEIPRAPNFQHLRQIRDVLSRHFAVIDLQVDDAGFEIDFLPPEIAESVTFRLPEGDERQRMAALNRFLGRRDAFKRRRVWPALTNIRTRAELKACLAGRTPFITGHGVCGPVSAPIATAAYDPERLPMTLAA